MGLLHCRASARRLAADAELTALTVAETILVTTPGREVVRSIHEKHGVTMRRLATIVSVVMSFAACDSEDLERTEEYQAGYNNGLEDQRAHICAMMENHDSAMIALRDERICT
jgi:hypothetical protein